MDDRVTGPLDQPRSAPLGWRANGGLFVLTLASVFVTLFMLDKSAGEATGIAVREAAEFTAALLSILLAHEFGHYVAARLHGVDASLPYFIPLPILSPFGTMGAVIRMRSIIPTRRALLDIGASGPLAGMAVALPLYAWGAAHSQVVPLDAAAGGELGSSLLLRALDRVFAPAIPEGMDLMLSPVAYAAWAGMFVTMINLLPAGQLDGGHVAFALLGDRQNRVARWVHRSMLVFFFVSVASFAARDVRAGFGLWHLGRHVYNSLFWLVWFEALAVLGSMTSRRPGGGPPTPNSSRTDDSLDQVPLATRAVITIGLVLTSWVLHDHGSAFLWMALLAALGVLITLEARWGALRPSSHALDHPPTGPTPLPLGRAIVAVVTLSLFVLLFMPTPFVF
jgi:membrane-associated protease RseP (regulator of RpoE activity)